MDPSSDFAHELTARVEALFADAREWRQEDGPRGLVVIANGWVKFELAPVREWTDRVIDQTIFTIGTLFPDAEEQRLIWRRRPLVETYRDYGPSCITCGHSAPVGPDKFKVSIRIGVEPL